MATPCPRRNVWQARRPAGGVGGGTESSGVEASRRRSSDHRPMQTKRMLHLRISSPAAMSEAVISTLSDDPAVSSLAVLPGASVRPAGDVVLADVAREAANDVVDRLRALELHHEGSLDIDQVRAWLSQRGYSVGTAPSWIIILSRSRTTSHSTIFSFARGSSRQRAGPVPYRTRLQDREVWRDRLCEFP
jgi:hypothetical protein